jgi:hypothetical protein
MMFLDEVGALTKVREIFGVAKEAKIAVAFWGRGAVQALGIDRSDLEAEIVCNLDSGACNPSEIGKLRELRPHIPVRSDPRLHGKLYWTPRGVVIGSSNASTNGLAVEDGLAGWAEANVFSDDQRLIDDALAWFEARKDSSYEITDAHLHLARQIWEQRSESAPPGLKLAGDLGGAVRMTPERDIWRRVKLAIYSEDLSAEGKRRMKADQRDNPSLKAFASYEDWQDAIDAGDWILDFWLNNQRAEFGGYWSVPHEKLENELLTYVREKPCLTMPGFGTLNLSVSDQRDLEVSVLAIARTKDASEHPCAMVPIREAIAFIDAKKDASVAPDKRAFERAMRDIFTEATKIGYRPIEFLRMVDREGALPTAKRLIMSSTPSSGFTRLWKLKRLDLTVEALALREPWRRLFTEVELKKAQQRLDQLNYKSEL